MKLSPRDAAGFFAKPDVKRPGCLIYGQDAMRVALKRQALVKELVGPNGEDEMRLTRIPGADVRKDKALVSDALKAVGFFPGQRVALVEDANDAAADGILSALADWADGDAFLVVTAGSLTPKSKLRKGFEAHPSAYAAAIYNDPPSRAEVESTLRSKGINDLDRDGQQAVEALAQTLDPGDFGQFVEKLSLYTLNQGTPVSVEDVEACAPTSTEAGQDDLINTLADTDTHGLAPLLQRLSAQGITATGLCNTALRHFKIMHQVASHPSGSDKGMDGLRPPIYGPRRNRILRQTKNWGRPRIEQALGLLIDLDRQLRAAGQVAPQMAVLERGFIRISMMGRR